LEFRAQQRPYASGLRADPSSETVSLTGMSGIVKNSEMDTIALFLESRLEEEEKEEEDQQREKQMEERTQSQTLGQVQKKLEKFEEEIMHSPTVINTNRTIAKFDLQRALFPAVVKADVACAMQENDGREGGLADSIGLENAVIDWDVAAHLYTRMTSAGSDPSPSTKTDANPLFFTAGPGLTTGEDSKV
jgi:hypothetical protein